MKLHELVEAFDTAFDLDWKAAAGGGSMAGFAVNGVPYIVQLTPIQINRRKIYEASFYLAEIKGDQSYVSHGTSSVPTTVYGIVANGLIDRLKHGDYESIFFSAERRHSISDEQHEAKLRIYEFAARRIAKKLGWELYLAPDEFLVFSEFQGDKFGRFEHWQNQIREALGSIANFQSLNRNQNV